MVQEHRTITLTPEELMLAFSAYSMATPNFLPNGKIVGCKTMEDGAVIISMEMQAEDDATLQADFTFKGSDVLEPLIRFCLETRIMLPKGGRKSYNVIDGSAALNIDLETAASISRMSLKQADADMSAAA